MSWLVTIRRPEKGYDKDRMSLETRVTLLYGQLQDGLRDSLTREPVVAGPHSYQELHVYPFAKNEEKQQRDLAKRRAYHRDDVAPSHMEGTGHIPQSPATINYL